MAHCTVSIACLLLVLVSWGAQGARLIPASRHVIASDDEWAIDAEDAADDLLSDQEWMLQDATNDPLFCTKKRFRNKTMKLVREASFVALLHDTMNQTRFEASGLVFLNNSFYVIFDNIRHIARIDHQLGDFSDDTMSILIPESAGDPEEESQFEAISYIADRDSFLILRESLRHPVDGKLNPVIEEVKITGGGKKPEFTVLNKCFIDFDLEAENKGFEGLHYFKGPDGEDLALGLCESNYCRTIAGVDPPGLDRGHGRIIVARFRPASDRLPCEWSVDKVVKIPYSAFLMDYAGIGFGALEGTEADVAIVSQEDSAIWVGRWDWETLDFASQKGVMWHLPRDNHCNKMYCNVEGVQFMDKTRVALTSDRCKGTQAFTCHVKDQAVHVFAMAA